MWWGVWWGWMIVWTLTLLAVLLLGGMLVARWRSRGGTEQPPRGICFYLHDASVMDLYLSGTYKRALRQEVEEEISTGKHGGLTAALRAAGLEAGVKVDRRVLQKYVEVAEPITVIRIVQDVLDKAHDIIAIDLISGEVSAGRALEKALRPAPLRGRAAVTLTELRDLEVYVSVRGRFREVAKTDTTITFEAPCGSGPAWARSTCTESGIRRSVPAGTFPARCLGKVQDWDPDTGRLVIDPIAIFQ
jgi:hypothetical protein